MHVQPGAQKYDLKRRWTWKMDASIFDRHFYGTLLRRECQPPRLNLNSKTKQRPTSPPQSQVLMFTFRSSPDVVMSEPDHQRDRKFDVDRPFMPRSHPPNPSLLLVYPCGTPMDFLLSRELTPQRSVYWKAVIPVSFAYPSSKLEN